MDGAKVLFGKALGLVKKVLALASVESSFSGGERGSLKKTFSELPSLSFSGLMKDAKCT